MGEYERGMWTGMISVQAADTVKGFWHHAADAGLNLGCLAMLTMLAVGFAWVGRTRKAPEAKEIPDAK